MTRSKLLGIALIVAGTAAGIGFALLTREYEAPRATAPAAMLPAAATDDFKATVANAAGAPGAAGGDEADDVRADLLSALTNLGYQRASVEKTVDKVLQGADDRSFEPLLRATLKLLIGR